MTHEQARSSAATANLGGPRRVIAARYAIVGEIGRGGMGIVWLAEDGTIGRQVAIKELHLPDGVPPQERAVFEERVLREARTAGRLNDPAVVTVYDVVQEAGNTYIVMELIQAPTLADLVKRGGPLPQDAVIALAGQLLSALEAAHAAGVIHRDVKPSNVMVLPNGRVKLMDFGIAQSLDDPRLTASGILVGSPTYIAPERIQGAEADVASDLWALGQVLFFAVEGYSPFERSTTAATMHAIITEVPYLTRCQGPLASVIMGLLINTPQARLRADQVRGLLAQVPGAHTGPQPVMYGPTVSYAQHPGVTSVAAGAPPPRPRNPVRTALAVVLAVLLLAGAFVGGLFTDRLTGSGTGSGADPARGQTLTFGSGGDMPEFELSNGSCSASPLGRGRSVESGSSCEEAHDFQVFGVHDTVSSASDIAWPGVDRLRALGEAWCGLLFASDYLTDDARASTLTYVTLIPTENSWRDKTNGSKEIVCAVHRRDGTQLNQSLVPS